jgi:beta-galactosidase
VRRGKGTATYLGARPDQESRDRLLAELAATAGIEPVVEGAQGLGIDAVRRRGAEGDYVFLLHYGETAVEASGDGTDLLTGAHAGSGLRLGARTSAVIRVERGAPVRVRPAA